MLYFGAEASNGYMCMHTCHPSIYPVNFNWLITVSLLVTYTSFHFTHSRDVHAVFRKIVSITKIIIIIIMKTNILSTPIVIQEKQSDPWLTCQWVSHYMSSNPITFTHHIYLNHLFQDSASTPKHDTISKHIWPTVVRLVWLSAEKLSENSTQLILSLPNSLSNSTITGECEAFLLILTIFATLLLQSFF